MYWSFEVIANTAANALAQEQAWYEMPITITSFVLATVIVNLVTIYKSWSEIKNQRKLFVENQNINEREDIRYRLNNFFGPMQELRVESRTLYDVFALKEKEYAEKSNIPFKTVRYLIEGKTFSSHDQALLEEIVEIAKKQLELIEKEGWVVKNIHLTELIGKLGAHIRVLLMAYEHKLDGMLEELEHLVFPLEIDGALDTEIRKLQDDYNKLLRGTTKETAPIKLEKEQRRIIAYYEKNHLSYFRKTSLKEMPEVYSKFRQHIPRGALILDAGCGVGRDTRYFIRHGYRVVAFDASKKMRNLCRQYPFAYCLRRSFDEIEFVEEFDAVWACASLLHLRPEKIREAFLGLFNAVKPGGIIYFSLKNPCKEINLSRTSFKGKHYTYSNEVVDNRKTGRRFYYYSKKDIEELFERELTLELLEHWENQGGVSNSPVSFTNFIYRRVKKRTSDYEFNNRLNIPSALGRL